jgi:hypothetical protein
MEIIRHFMSGKMNKSLDERLVPNGEYVDAMNIRVNATEGSDVGTVENSLGNQVLTQIQYNGAPISSTARTIGYFADGANETIYWFIHSEADEVDMVVSYNDNTDSLTYHVISTSVLNFDDNYLITGVDKIEDLLFWTDDLNPPRRINVTRSYPQEPDLTESDINVIVSPPKNSPKITLINLPGEENYIESRFISFSYRYKYKDGEYSALSQFSKIAFQPGFFSLNIGTYQNDGMLNQFNAARVTVDSGGDDVVGIDICFKLSNQSVVNVIDKFDKKKLGWPDNSEVSQIFTNKKVYTTLKESELLRLFDNVPIKAQAQTLMGNRIIYGNYVDGFDLLDDNLDPIKIGFEAELVSEDVSDSEIDYLASNFSYSFGLPGPVIGEDSKITIDFSGQELKQGNVIGVNLNIDHSSYSGSAQPTGFQAPFVISSFITLTRDYVSVYDLSISDEFKLFIGSENNHGGFSDCGSSTQISTLTDSFICAVSNYSEWVKTSFGLNTINQGILIESSVSSSEISIVLPWIKYTSPTPGSELYQYFKIISAAIGYRNEEVTGSLHSNRSYSVGIVYMDEYNRATTVLLSENNTIFVPSSASSLRNYIKVTIPSTQKPPFWATKYKFLVLPSALDYETVYSNKFFIDPFDGGTWFKLEGDNQNKTKLGDRLIVKVDSNGAVPSLVEATVLEISSKEKNFIAENTNDAEIEIIEPTGLYMSLQPKGWSAFYADSQVLGGVKVQSGKGREYPKIRIPVSDENPDTPGQWVPWPIKQGDIVRFEFRFYREKNLFSGCRSRIYTYQKEFVSNSDYDDVRSFVNTQRILFNNGTSTGDGQTVNGNTYNSELATSFDQPVDPDDNLYQFVQETNGKMSLFLISSTPSCGFRGITNNWSYVDGSVSVIKSGNIFAFETQPTESNSDIYFEGHENYDVVSGSHSQTDITLDIFNCFSFGNGIESYKVRDALAAPYFRLGERVSSVAEQDFKQIRRYAGLTYSGVYNQDTNINRLNEFNLALANFIELERRWGPIRKIYARQTDILVLQEDRISYVLAGKNLLSDSAGGGAITSVPQVLAQQIARQEEFGISFHPESFAVYGYDKFFTDAKRGVVLKLQGTSYSNETLEIVSDLGLREWFRELFIGSLQTQKLGGYDPYAREYVLSSNEIRLPLPPINIPCGSSYQSTVPAAGSVSISGTLIDISGDFSVSYRTVSGEITSIDIDYNGSIQSSPAASGIFNFTKDTRGAINVSIDISSALGAAVEVSLTCPTPQDVTIVKVCINSNDYSGQNIHNENMVVGDTFVLSDLVELQSGTGIIVSQYRVISGNKGDSYFPADGDSVRIISNKRIGDDFVFSLSDHKLRYYEANALYANNPADINFILGNSSFVIPTQAGNSNYSDYTYTGGQYVYLIYDYRKSNPLELCYSVDTSIDACCVCQVTTTTTTTTTTLPYSTFALYLKTDEGTGWPSDDQAAACSGTGSIFYLFGAPGYTDLQSFFNDGKKLFSNTALTIPYNGQSKWFKTSGQPNQGRTINIGPDGFINTIGPNC